MGRSCPSRRSPRSPKADASWRGWEEPAARIFHDQRYGYYSVSFYFPGEDRGTGGMGMKQAFFAADVFMQMQFPVHSGRVLGLPGRILMSVMGLVVAALAATGRRRLVPQSPRAGGGGAPAGAVACCSVLPSGAFTETVGKPAVT